MTLKIKKIIYIAISVIIVMCLMSIFIYRQNEMLPVQTLERPHLELLPVLNVDNEDIGDENIDNDNTDTKKTESNLFFKLPLASQAINLLEIELDGPLQKDNFIKAHYITLSDGQIVENIATASNLDNTNSNRLFIFFNQPVTDASNIKIESHDELSVKSISTYNSSEYNLTLKFNFTALCVLLISLVILLLLEKILGFYKWIFSSIKNHIRFTKELPSKTATTFHVLSCASTITFVGSCIIFMMLNMFGKVTAITSFVLATLSIILQLSDRLISKKGIEPAKLFLTVSAIVGILICFTLPVSTHLAWDDEIHFRQAYTIANGTTEQVSLAQWRLFVHNYTRDNYIVDPSQFISTIMAENSLIVDYKLPSVNLYTSLGYLPMAGSIFMSSLMRVDIAKMLVLCRFANLFIYIAVMYCSIRKLKSGGYIASAIALLPSTLYLACSCSYDSWLTMWFAYAIIYVISIYQNPEKKFGTCEIVKILTAMFIACGPKPIYCVMFLPLLFLDTNKFKSKKQAKIFRFATIVTVIAIALILVIPTIFVYNFHTDPRGGSDVNGGEQIKYILSHPFKYGFVLLRHMGEYASLKSFVDYSSGFGYITGYDVNPITFYGSFSAIIILYCIIVDRKKDDLYDSRSMQTLRWISFLTMFFQIVVICTTMYIGFTGVGADYINGCQFRYLFPLLFPICFFIAPKGIRINMGTRLKCGMIFAALALNLLYGYLFTYVLRF